MSNQESEVLVTLVDMIEKHDRIGGVAVGVAINETMAAFATKRLDIPSEDSVRTAIFDLLASEAVRMVSHKLRMPEVKGTPNKGSKDSFMVPCGPGDHLFNAEGKAVAVITNMRKDKEVLSSGDPFSVFGPTVRIRVIMEVDPLFDNFYMSDGSPLPDEVAGPPKNKSRPLAKPGNPEGKDPMQRAAERLTTRW